MSCCKKSHGGLESSFGVMRLTYKISGLYSIDDQCILHVKEKAVYEHLRDRVRKKKERKCILETGL